jgi:hypothetical protein
MSKSLLICCQCGWKVDPGLMFLHNTLDKWIPPCSVCEGILEGYRVLDERI